MRAKTVLTDQGANLAVLNGTDWCVLDATSAPTSVDELVHGGVEARKQVEEALPRARRVSTGVSTGLCIPWPSKIVCIGANYRRHAAEAGSAVPITPMIFSKFHNALTGSGQPVRLSSNASEYDYEGELGVVIGRTAVRVSEPTALDYVWGYCNVNDLSARDLQRRTSQIMLGKTLDGFLPVGPELVSADEVGDPQNLRIRTWLNGELRQDSNTSDMVFGVKELVSYISQYIPLQPGDIIASGTPEGVIMGRKDKVWMKGGDVVEVEVEGLGRLVTPLVNGD
jgi:2-keto-4-pentenoate hydratase/2-oxohepta-3-ene-1,7-dioic acid hydratase in catechol pathway